MKRFVQVIWKLIILVVSLPLIKGFYDIFTAPVTGLLVVAGADANTLAFITAIPWILPIGCFIAIIYDLSKKDEETPSGMGGMSFPK